LGQVQRQLVKNGNFPCDADMAQAIGTIAGHFQINGLISTDLLSPLMIEPGHGQSIDQVVVPHV
jgi:hypothetical protein